MLRCSWTYHSSIQAHGTVENRLACVANNMAHVARLVLGRFMFRRDRTRLHGNALNLCVVMDTLPHFLLASTPF
jgi:hypothetical protein